MEKEKAETILTKNENESKKIRIEIKTNPLAIASMVLGISGLCTIMFLFGIPAIIGFILGIIALVQINKSNGTSTGKGLAITGIATSATTIFILFIVICFYIFLLILAILHG